MRMNILVSCNDNYGMPTMVMLKSLMEMNPAENSLKHTVYMLETDLSEKWNRRIEELVKDHGWDYACIHMPDDLFASANTKPYISKETYYRLISFKYLPADVSKILWLDSDIIVRKGLKEFYNSELKGKMTAACSYGPAMKSIICDNAVKLKMAFPEDYFNAGVMLLNVDECRKNLSEESIAEIIYSDKAKTFMFPGQDTVNLLFDGRAVILDYRYYNCMIHCIEGREDLSYAKENAAIVHFPGEAKPWKFSDIHFADEWYMWYRRCFGESAELKRMSYFRLKALFDRQRGNI